MCKKMMTLKGTPDEVSLLLEKKKQKERKKVTGVRGSEPPLKPNYNSKPRRSTEEFQRRQTCFFFFVFFMSVEGFF